MSQLDSQFHTWWHDEGKFQVPPTKDYNAIKKLCEIAFMNGAYVQAELIILDKNRRENETNTDGLHSN